MSGFNIPPTAEIAAATASLVPNTRTVASYALSSNVTLAKGDVGLGNVDNTSDTSKPISTAQQTAIDAAVLGGNSLLIHQALGSTLIAENFPAYLLAATGVNLTDGIPEFHCIYLSKSQTITGVKWMQQTQGSYTADNYNGIGLYTYSAGTLTLVASSTNNGNIWKAATSATVATPFSSTYPNAAVGLYFVAMLYNSSAQTTAPQVARCTAVNSTAYTTLDYTNSGRYAGVAGSSTALPTPQAISGLTASPCWRWFGLY